MTPTRRLPVGWRVVYAMAWLDGDAAPAKPCKDGGMRNTFPPYFVGCDPWSRIPAVKARNDDRVAGCSIGAGEGGML
jgi:hypothetical protein